MFETAKPCLTNADCVVPALGALGGFGLGAVLGYTSPTCIDGFCACSSGSQLQTVVGIADLVCVKL